MLASNRKRGASEQRMILRAINLCFVGISL